jgi:serine/threonine protein kinase/Tfp pilus assembly protein PilF
MNSRGASYLGDSIGVKSNCCNERYVEMTEFQDDNTRTHAVMAPGTLVSHYRIIEKIGAGGMGEVYLAEDKRLDRKVALKFLPERLSGNEESRNRFVREAKATARLNHPNIVTIYEVGEHNGLAFFAMEFVEGKSLKRMIHDEAFMLDRVVEIATRICEGLQEAHNTGIIHRDIKPANILVDRAGRPKILDFGLATLAGMEQLTKTGSTLGTVGYMSPEQVQGRTSDHRTDLFSFGVVLYELITGRRPFEGDTEAHILNTIINDQPEPISRYRSGIPDELIRIVDKLLEKSPDLRYQSASGVVSDLKRLDITGQLRPSTEVKIRSERKMIVVLPFENLGPADDEYFADGITEEIISRLAVVKKLGVISRTSALQYKGTRKPIGQIGRELKVDYVLEGTVRWSKGKEVSRVRITPQLIKVADDTHMWSDRYDRTLEDIFDVQSDIAEKVIEQLNVTLLEPEKQLIQNKPTSNMDAYNAYLRAQECLYAPDYREENTRSAIRLFERAISFDSGFVHAYAELSIAHTRMYFFAYDTTQQRIESAREALEKAQEINNSIPEVFLARAVYYYHIERDYEKAVEAAEIAAESIPVEPNWYLFAIRRRQGRYDEALEKIHLILSLNPNDPTALMEAGITYGVMNRYDEAEKYLLKAESVAPDSENTYEHLAWTYIRGGADLEKIKGVIERMPQAEEEAWSLYYYYSGEYAKALELIIANDYRDVFNQAIYFPGRYRAASMRYVLGEKVPGSEDIVLAIQHLESALVDQPADHRVHATLCVCFALNDEREKALASGRRAMEIMPRDRDCFAGPLTVLFVVEANSILGEFDAACDLLEPLFSSNSFVTPAWVKRHPVISRQLADFPRFQQLLGKYGA